MEVVQQFPEVVCVAGQPQPPGYSGSDDPHIPHNKPYLIHSVIGTGSFATVYLMQMLKTTPPRLVVGKFMNTTAMPERNRLFALAEQNNSSRCLHPNIVEFVESFQNSSGYLLLIFEFADAGDLSKQIEMRASILPEARRFREAEVVSIITQISLALLYLHNQNIMHRDIKSANVFLTKCGLIKLGDFGLSRQYASDVAHDVGMTFVGTPYYVAPELWQQQSYSAKADMWSLGVLMYELMAMRKPFTGVSMSDLIGKISNGVFDPLAPECGYSSELNMILQSLLSVEPSQRPSIAELLQHPLMLSGLEQLRKAAPHLPIDDRTKQLFVADIDRVLLAQQEAQQQGP